MNKRKIYFTLFVLSLFVEIVIGLYIRDNFVRPYIGDVLVIIVMASLLRMFFVDKPKYLGIYVTLFAILVEIMQYYHLDRILNVQGTFFGVLIGATFDWKDILCYVIGGIIFVGCERILQSNVNFR